MVECIVGSASPKRMCCAIASSLNSFTKSARQYHCKPGGYRASNMLCNAGCGSGPTKSRAGFLKSADGLECFFCFRLRADIGPNYAAHFLHVQVFGERRHRRHSEKSKETVQIIGSCCNQ